MQMNLEGLKKTPQKPEDWDLNPGDFQNMCQIKPKKEIIFVMVYCLITLLAIKRFGG